MASRRYPASYSQTALAASVAHPPLFDEEKGYDTYPTWREDDARFSESRLAASVQSHARQLQLSTPRRRDAYAQRDCSESFGALMKAYPAVRASNLDAAHDMQALFTEFGTKKVRRQFEGLVTHTEKQVESAAHVAAKRKRTAVADHKV